MREETPQEQNEQKHSKLASSITLIILALIIAALIGYVVYNNNKDSYLSFTSQQTQIDAQAQQLEELVQTTEQNIQQQQEAITVAQQNLSEKEAILAEGAAQLANQSCENALETAKTQKTVLTKEINDITTISKSIENSPDFAIDVCRQLNPELSKPECETRIDTKATEAELSIIEMEAIITDLDERIATGCTSTDEEDPVTDTQTPETSVE